MTPGIRRTVQSAIAIVALAGVTLVANAPVRQQMDLKERIQYGLETSKITKKYYIEVAVDGSDVTLSGIVATAAQKEEAARVATVAGAKKLQNAIVVDKNVDVKVADRLKAGLTKTGDKISDAWILTRVKWFYTGDDLLKGSDIDVDVHDNVVTLSGTVKSQAGRARAVALAEDTDGVHRVIDKLTIAR